MGINAALKQAVNFIHPPPDIAMTTLSYLSFLESSLEAHASKSTDYRIPALVPFGVCA
jgi:hypothetical protein